MKAAKISKAVPATFNCIACGRCSVSTMFTYPVNLHHDGGWQPRVRIPYGRIALAFAPRQ
jgi:hypothetical protein